MAGETVITVVGNLTADPELRFTQTGLALASFTVASTEKIFDKATNNFKDGKTLFMRCTAWREMAEHVAGSLAKGTRVVVVGKIATNEYEDKDHNKRSSIELTVDEIGPSLRYATAQVTRTTSGGGGARGGQGQVGQGGDEPWAASGSGSSEASSGSSSGDVWNTPGNFNDETPF